MYDNINTPYLESGRVIHPIPFNARPVGHACVDFIGFAFNKVLYLGSGRVIHLTHSMHSKQGMPVLTALDRFQ